MSAAEKKALNDRALMEANLGTAHHELNEYCGQASPGARKVQRLLNTLHTAWKELTNSHVSYCSAMGMEMGSVESQAYLKEQRGLYFAGKKAGEEILDKGSDSETDTKDQMGLELKGDISFMQLEIDNDIKCLTKVLGAATLSTEGYREAGEMMKCLEQKLMVDYKTLSRRLKEYLKSADAKEEKDKADKYLETKRPVYGDLKTKMMMMKSPNKDEKVQVNAGK